jgi:tight adherence protein B
MTNVLLVVLLLGAVTAAEGVYYLVRYLNERPAEELRRRLRTVGQANAGVQILRRRRLGSSRWQSELLSGFAFSERLEKLLDQTDSELTVAGLLFRMLAFGLLGAVAPLIMQRPVLSLVFAPLLAAAPILLIVQARAARTKKISEQLPDTIDMMARALKAGHAVPASFKLVAQECPLPVAVEFAKAYEQQNLGLSLEAATHSMTERVPGCLDLKLLAVSIKIQGETGGNLVEVLEKIADTMRERFKFYSKLRAITAEARMSGAILAALPILVAILISFTNPSYLAELGHGPGRAIIAAGAFLWVMGVFWIKRLSKVVY